MYSHPKLLNQHIAACSVHQNKQHLAVLSFEITNNGRIQITPDGYFRASDGRPYELPKGWFINASVAERVLARLSQRKNRMVIDYEHQTLYAEYNGQAAPAAGWVVPSDIEYIEGEGLFSVCSWTDKAKAMIDAGEYLYLSPVFEYDPETGDVLNLINIAITNQPALDGMETLEALRKSSLSSQSQQEEKFVDREELIRMLGLSDNATDEEIRAALKASQQAAAQLTALRGELGINDGDDPVAAIATLKSSTATPDPAKYVPAQVVEDLKTEVAALRADRTADEVDALVKQGLDDGKLLAAQEPWARELGKKDVAALKGYLDKTPAIAALKGTQTGGNKPEGADNPELSKEELAVCKQMGISPEEYIKQNKAEG